MMYTCDMARLDDKIKTFSAFGDAGHGGVTRFALSKEDLLARAEFTRRMEAVGAVVTTDDMANMYATIPGDVAGLPAIAMASHSDSVRNGGNYDGILGVLSAMEVVESIVTQKIPHRHPITAMIWTNEEGACHSPAMMASGVICGKFERSAMLASKSPAGDTFEMALRESGLAGDVKNRLNPQDYACMFELHIEQGPILEAAGNEIGVVQCVLGMVNYRIRTYGQAGHAGTVPMKHRRDALYAAAQALVYLHTELDKLDPALVYTTGEIICRPCVHTVVPEFVEFTIDARHESPAVIRQVVAVIEGIPQELASCRVAFERSWSRDTIHFDRELVGFVQKNADAFAYPNQPINSGAGHDAQFVSELLPTAMIFVPSKGGHSHCEIEYTSIEQCWKGTNVLLQSVLDADGRG